MKLVRTRFEREARWRAFGEGVRVALFAALVVFMVVAVTGCVGAPTPYAELGVGWNTSLGGKGDHHWNDGGAGPGGATIEAGVTWDVRNNPDLQVDCRWLHVSHWFVGPPFNDRAEDSLDHFGCSARYEWRD